MNCEYCGTALPANAKQCPACGAPVCHPVATAATDNTSSAPGANIPSYLVWSILTTIFCCIPVFPWLGIPFGITAIVYRSKILSSIKRGDYVKAQRASLKAKRYCIIAAIIGAIGLSVEAILLIPDMF